MPDVNVQDRKTGKVATVSSVDASYLVNVVKSHRYEGQPHPDDETEPTPSEVGGEDDKEPPVTE